MVENSIKVPVCHLLSGLLTTLCFLQLPFGKLTLIESTWRRFIANAMNFPLVCFVLDLSL
jgi:hypothetical protein